MYASPLDRFITVADAAQALAVGQSTLRDYIRRGQLPAFRVGGSVRIRVHDLNAFLTPVTAQAGDDEGDDR